MNFITQEGQAKWRCQILRLVRNFWLNQLPL